MSDGGQKGTGVLAGEDSMRQHIRPEREKGENGRDRSSHRCLIYTQVSQTSQPVTDTWSRSVILQVRTEQAKVLLTDSSTKLSLPSEQHITSIPFLTKSLHYFTGLSQVYSEEKSFGYFQHQI